MVVVVSGFITVVRAVEDMTATVIAVHVPHLRIRVTETGHIIVVLAALVNVAPLHPALAPVLLLTVMF